jgi:hypothetical protein
MRPHPLPRRHVRLHVPIENRLHDFTLPPKSEFQVMQQPPQVRALRAQSRACHRVDRRAAEVRPEAGIAPRQVLDLEAKIHGMRIPPHEHDRLVIANGALELGQHPLLAGLDETEVPQPEGVGLDHSQHQPIGRSPRLDTVDG